MLQLFWFKVYSRTRYTSWHMHIKLFLDSIIIYRNTDILYPKNGENAHFEHVINCFSDMPQSISFKLGTKVVHVGSLMHVIFFRDLIQNCWLASILFYGLCILSHFSNMLQPIWFKVDTRTRYTGWHMHIKLFQDSIIFFLNTAILYSKNGENPYF